MLSLGACDRTNREAGSGCQFPISFYRGVLDEEERLSGSGIL